MRAVLAAISLALLTVVLIGSDANAKARQGVHRHHVHRHHVQHVVKARRHRVRQVKRHAVKRHHAPGMVTIRTSAGLPVRVAANAVAAFSGFLREFEAGGYRIRFIGGYRHTKIAGTNHWSKHASGLAIDVCQTARNRVACRMPPDVTAMAARHGLLHGAVWRHPDAGHFEVPSSHYALARRGRRV